MTISEFELRAWVDEMSALTERLMATFQEIHGFPPGDNRVDAIARGADLPGDLADLYSQVGAVHLPDVDHGYFIRAAADCEFLNVAGAVPDTVTVFGSDGGGGLYALNAVGDRVYVLSGGSLVGSTWDAGTLTVVADGLWEFLVELRSAARSAARTAR